jgi:hypothetical protein
MKTSLRVLIAALVIAAAFLALHGGTSAQSDRSNNQSQENKFRRSEKPLRDHYIVVLNRETPAEQVEPLANEFLGKHGGAVRQLYQHSIKGFSIEFPEAAAMALSRDPRVEYVEEDAEATFDHTEGTTSWNISRIDQRTGLDGNYYFPNVENGAGVNAYIIDTGIKASHREFSLPDGSKNRATADADLVWWNNTYGDDCFGHGTEVAGVLGGRGFGAAKGVRLHGVRVGDCTAFTTTSTIIAGVDWVTQNHVKPAVVNMSLGVPNDSALEDAIRASIAAGLTYVVSAGNANVDVKDTSPARMPEVITVGATIQGDARASFSNFGPGVDLFAPGDNVLSASIVDGNGDGIFSETAGPVSGTSFAAPLVAATVARFLQANPNASPAAVQGAILSTATKDVLTDIGPGSPNRLLFADLRHAFLGQNTVSVFESSLSVDSGVDMGPGQWMAMTGSGQISSGVLFSGLNGPQGWNTIENSTSFPLPGSRPYSLIGRLDGQNFYIGTSAATTQSFSSAKRLTLRTNDNSPGDGSGAFGCKVEVWKVLPEARADFIDQVVPDVVMPGQTYPVMMIMQNVGPTTWTAGQGFKLATLDDNIIWGVNRVVVPTDVPPGSEVTFNFNITAPMVPGNYNFSWRMLQEGVQRFGDVSFNRQITVLTPSNQAQFISQSVKSVMTASEPVTVSITMQNMGNTTWKNGTNYRLGSQNAQDNLTWGLNRVTLPFDVPPGGIVTFTFDVMPPAKAGTYNFQWRMVQDGVEWFGQSTPNVAVSVKLPSCLRC